MCLPWKIPRAFLDEFAEVWRQFKQFERTRVGHGRGGELQSVLCHDMLQKLCDVC